MTREFLAPIDARIARAENQAQELVAAAKIWGKENPVTGIGQLMPERMGFELRLEGLKDVDQFSLPAGECIHNLRSALDNLAFAMARLKIDPPIQPRDIHFPLSTNEADFYKSTKRFLPQLTDTVAHALYSMQPLQRRGRMENGVYEGMPHDDPLLLLHRINVSDKHRSPVVATLAPSSLRLSGGVEFESNEAASRNTPPDVEIVLPLRNGDVFMRLKTKYPLVHLNTKFDLEASISLAAGEDFVEIGETLTHLSRQVNMVVNYFRGFFDQ